MKFNFSSLFRVSFTGVALLLILLQQTTSSYTRKMAETIWQQLGISQQQGTENIRQSFISGYSNAYGFRNAKNIASGNKATVARNLFQYTKTYISGAEFKNLYNKARTESKPIAPVAAKTKEEVRKEMIADMEKSIRDTEKSMASMTPDIRKALQPSLDDARKQLEEYRKPENKIVEIRYQGELARFESDQKRYQEDLAFWESNYPADIKQLIKSRLQKYLSLAATVDFNAELVLKNGKKKFVNPDYESKHSDWKMIYRAGADVYAVVKPLVEEWIRGLGD